MKVELSSSLVIDHGVLLDFVLVGIDEQGGGGEQEEEEEPPAVHGGGVDGTVLEKLTHRPVYQTINAMNVLLSACVS